MDLTTRNVSIAHLIEFCARIRAILADNNYYRNGAVLFLSVDIVDPELPIDLLSDKMIARIQKQYLLWGIRIQRENLIIRFTFIPRPIQIDPLTD